MILSQMAGDPDLKFLDLDIIAGQGHKLFAGQLDVQSLKSPHLVDETAGCPKVTHEQIVSVSQFTTQAGVPRKVVLIKPTPYNIDGFYAFLNENPNYQKVLSYLQQNERDPDNKNRFPQNPTFSLTYPQLLIHGYYLLGQYVAKNHLAPVLLQVAGDY